MRKISTLYKKNPSNLNLVINEIDPTNVWVLTEGLPTRKFDGTSCAIINGDLYKRYDAKKGKKVPNGAIPCQEPDSITGHYPHWVKCQRNNSSDKYHFEAFDKNNKWQDGTYELCGPKVGINAEHFTEHVLIQHGSVILDISDFSFENLKNYFMNKSNDIEGIVFHHKDGRMCKIRKKDFGIKR